MSGDQCDNCLENVKDEYGLERCFCIENIMAYEGDIEADGMPTMEMFERAWHDNDVHCNAQKIPGVDYTQPARG